MPRRRIMFSPDTRVDDGVVLTFTCPPPAPLRLHRGGQLKGRQRRELHLLPACRVRKPELRRVKVQTRAIQLGGTARPRACVPAHSTAAAAACTTTSTCPHGSATCGMVCGGWLDVEAIAHNRAAQCKAVHPQLVPPPALGRQTQPASSLPPTPHFAATAFAGLLIAVARVVPERTALGPAVCDDRPACG